MDEFFAVLLRLCQGVNLEFVAILFNVHETTIVRTFQTWIRILSLELSDLFRYCSKEYIEKWMLPQFCRYPNTQCIIDCTEFFIEQPSSINTQVLTYSSYKNHNTLNSADRNQRKWSCDVCVQFLGWLDF